MASDKLTGRTIRFLDPASTTFIYLGANVFNGAPGVSGSMKIINPSASNITQFVGTASMALTSSTQQTLMIGGYWNTSAVIDGFQVLSSSGNLTSGVIKIYGIQ